MDRRRTYWLSAAILLTPAAALAQAKAPTTEVVVQAQRLDRRSSRDETANSTVFRRHELAQPGASIASIVARSPGAQSQRSGATSERATLSLRGTPSAQLPVYLGPIALNDDLTGTADLSLVPLFFIERIEVYRGHAPSFVDRLGMSGALVIEPRLPKGSEWYGGVTFGSYGASSLYTGAAVANERVSNLVAVQRTTAANNYPYLDNRGTVTDSGDDRRVLRQNSDAESLELWTTGQYRPTPSIRLRWLAHGFAREQGITGLSIIPAQHTRARTQRELGALTATLPCRANRSEEGCNIELQSQWQHSHLSIDDPFLELGYGSTRVDSTAARLSERLRVTHRLLPEWSLGWLIGADVGTLDWVNREERGLRAQRRSGLLGLNSTLQLTRRLTLVTLGRLSLDHTRADEYAGSWTSLPSGRLGAKVEVVPGLAILANVGGYGRTPTLAELYGTSTSLRGNPELRAERGTSEDLGLRWGWTTGKFYGNAEAIAYHQHSNELVAWQRTSFGQVRPYNIGQARLLGAELSAGVGWNQSFEIEAVASLLDPRDVSRNRTNVNDILPYRSRFVGHLRFDAHLPHTVKLPGLREAGIGATVQRRSSRYSAPAGNAVLPSSITLDLDASIVLLPVPITLRGNILNVFDRQNYDLLGMPLPGRCYFVGAEIRLEFER